MTACYQIVVHLQRVSESGQHLQDIAEDVESEIFSTDIDPAKAEELMAGVVEHTLMTADTAIGELPTNDKDLEEDDG